MRLHAILCYYDESPTWLAATITSLTRIGVDHVLAIDGKYPHFKPGAPACSPVEQAVAIVETASAAGMACTLSLPDANGVMLETTKRQRAFNLIEELATPFEDWVLVIDADEIVEGGHEVVKRELAAIDADTHVAACRISSQVDPYAAPGPDNDIRDNTEEMHQKLLIDAKFSSAQSRFWRVLSDFEVGPAHYHYTACDESGERLYLRADISGKQSLPHLRRSPIVRVDACHLLHRKNHRTHVRRVEKKTYYDLRDACGLEAAPSPVAT